MPSFTERFFPNRKPPPVVPWVGHYRPLDPSLSPALSEAIRKLKASREQILLTREQDIKE